MLVKQFRLQLISNSCFSSFSYNIMTVDLLLSATRKGWKEPIGFPDPELYAESFGKKIHSKKSNIQEARQPQKIIGVAISSHIISFRFFPISRHFRITQENQNQLIRSRKISCNWGKNIFFDYLRRKYF